jgi:hypothetical protein
MNLMCAYMYLSQMQMIPFAMFNLLNGDLLVVLDGVVVSGRHGVDGICWELDTTSC